MQRIARGRRRLVPALLVGALVVGGCAISQQREVELGRDYSAQLDRELPIVNDAAIQRYLSALGAEIARGTSRTGITYRFRLVNSNVANAFAVPGGWVYVNRGVVERASTMSELAGVLAHEIAHVEHRHGVEQLERAQATSLGATLAYVLLGRSPGGVERAALGVGNNLMLSSHSREAESEADETAVALLVRAGIDPRGLPAFFRKLVSAQSQGSSGVAQWFSTHPTTADRIDAVERVIGRTPGARRSGLQRDSNAFQTFRANVRRLPAPRN